MRSPCENVSFTASTRSFRSSQPEAQSGLRWLHHRATDRKEWPARYVKLTVSDLERSKKFYEQALAPLGYQVASEGDGFVGLGAADHAIPDLWLGLGDVTSATHVAFRADRAGVEGFYEAALGAGGEDNGSPGIRAHYHENYYGAFAGSGWPQRRGRLPRDRGLTTEAELAGLGLSPVTPASQFGV